MKRIVLLLLAVCAVSACNGGNHTPTDTGTAPTISNLKALSFFRIDATTGTLPLAFDFADPEGDVNRVFVKISNGVADNPLQDTSGRKMGTASIIQSVLLPDPAAHQLEFTVQVADARGNLSNVLSGQVPIQ